MVTLRRLRGALVFNGRKRNICNVSMTLTFVWVVVCVSRYQFSLFKKL